MTIITSIIIYNIMTYQTKILCGTIHYGALYCTVQCSTLHTLEFNVASISAGQPCSNTISIQDVTSSISRTVETFQ